MGHRWLVKQLGFIAHALFLIRFEVGKKQFS